MRVKKWMKQDSIVAMIVKNSIFLNDRAEKFRKDFINKNQLHTFYELSNYNKILFKKKVVGKIRGKETIEIGASEPCAITIFTSRKESDGEDYTINYIAPKLTSFSEHFEVIQISDRECFEIKKSEFEKSDVLWRVLVNSDYEGFRLIQDKIFHKKILL